MRMRNNVQPRSSNGVLVYGWLQKESVPSPANQCTSAANGSVQQVLERKRTTTMMLCIVYLVAGNANFSRRYYVSF